MKKLFLLFMLVGFASWGIAQELLIVRGNGFYPPHEMIIDKHLTGLHIDLVTKVATRLGLQVKFKSVPWQRAIHLIQQQKADAITYMSKTQERAEFVYFQEGNILSYIENSFFTLKDQLYNIHYTGDYHQLQPYKIGKLAGYSYDPVFDKATYLKLDDSPITEEQLLNMLGAGRFDLAIGDISRIKYIARQLGMADKIIFLHPPLSRKPVYLAFSKAKVSEQLAKQFANEMARFKQSEHFRQLLKKYGL